MDFSASWIPTFALTFHYRGKYLTYQLMSCHQLQQGHPLRALSHLQFPTLTKSIP